MLEMKLLEGRGSLPWGPRPAVPRGHHSRGPSSGPAKHLPAPQGCGEEGLQQKGLCFPLDPPGGLWVGQLRLPAHLPRLSVPASPFHPHSQAWLLTPPPQRGAKQGKGSSGLALHSSSSLCTPPPKTSPPTQACSPQKWQMSHQGHSPLIKPCFNAQKPPPPMQGFSPQIGNRKQCQEVLRGTKCARGPLSRKDP